MMRYLLTISLILSLFALPALGAPPATERPKLIVGGDHDNPPYEFLENGKPIGFNIELIRAVGDVMGFDVEIRLGPWNQVRHDLEQGKVDMLAGMYNSVDRSRLVDFSVPHTMVSSGIFVRKEAPVHTFADLHGKEIIVQEGDIIYDLLKENGLTSRIIAVTDPEDVLRLLASGKHDGALMPSRLQGEYFAKKLGLANVRAINSDLPQLRYCFAVHKGNRELLYRLDEGLNILKVNGKYREIYEKWFGVYEKREMWNTIRYFIWVLAAIAALLTANFIWSWILQREVKIRTAKLRESEEMFRVLTETSPAGIFLYQGERIVYVNPATASMFGYTEQECLQMKFWDWVHDDFKELVRERGLARQRGEQAPSRYECKHLCKNGEERWMFVSVGLIEYRGKPAGIVSSFDITDRKRMENELQHAHDELEKRVIERTTELARLNSTLEIKVEEEVAKNREKDIILIHQNRQAALGELLDHIAHQWKQPLNVINLITYDLGESYARGGLSDEYVTTTVDKIISLTQHMAQTIHVFRDFYKPEKEKIVFRVKEAIEQAVSFVAPALRFHSIALELDVDPELSAIGYPKEYAQVLLNILSNARDAFKERRVEKPLMKIRAFADGMNAVVTITDNAGGIPDPIIGKIFDIYYTTKEVSGGTGIGLHMSKNIIEKNMGGTLSVLNVEQGAQFRIEVNMQG
jgi:PAS domain S-box-containing protein